MSVEELIKRTVKPCYESEHGEFQETKIVYDLNGKRLGKMSYCKRFHVGANGFRCPRTGDVIQKPNTDKQARKEKKYLCISKEESPGWVE